MCGRSDLVKGGPKRPLHEDLKVRPTFQWRSQHFGHVKSMVHLLRKAEATQRGQFMRAATVAMGNRTIRVGLPKPTEVKRMSQQNPDVRYRVLAFGICHAGFHPCFYLVSLPFLSLMSPF